MSKLDQIKALGAAKAACRNRSEALLDGEVRLGAATGDGRNVEAVGLPKGPATATNLAKEISGALHTDAPIKKKRAPRGTFDRKTYQRELMRKRRQKEKRE